MERTRLASTCAHCQVAIEHGSGVWWQAGTCSSVCPVEIHGNHCPSEAWLLATAGGTMSREEVLAELGFVAELVDLHNPLALEAWLAS